MRAAHHPPQARFDLTKTICIIFIFCAAAAILSTAQTITTLTNFDGTNGSYPLGALVQGSDGNFYGTTSMGGNNGPFSPGTVFKVTANGTLTTLHNFSGNDGNQPQVPLVLATDGNFYGTTWQGGASNYGTVFKITALGAFTLLYSFTGGADGRYPGPLIQASDGNFYGTALGGANNNCEVTDGCGLVFKMTPQGNFTKIYQFQGASNDGYGPVGIVQGRDGNFYGMAVGFGSVRCSSTCGSVFKVTPQGELTTLHWFNGEDGNDPSGQLLQAADGNFYGTTSEGGAYYQGTVFKMTPSGTLTSLYSFCQQYNCPDGGDPLSGLIQATDGTLYGTTAAGGTYGCTTCGTIFKITSTGNLTTLFSFNDTSNGGSPGGLLQATDGNFYGVTSGGGTSYYGTFFQFYPTPSTLNVSTSGDGTVTSTDGFINCPGTCSHNYYNNAPVTLNAGPGTGWVFVGWNGACAGTGSCNLTMTQSFSVDAIFSEPLQFVSVSPCRLIDTRTQNPISGGTSRNFILPLLGGCNIPRTSSAYSLNVTVVPHGPLGYLTIWPTGQTQPAVSTMNSLDGRIKANPAIVSAGAGGAVSVFASNTTDVVLDIDGYFTMPTAQTAEFYPLTPCRVVDTRGTNSNLGGPLLTGGMERDFAVLASSCIPANANPQAYSFNVTVVPHTTGIALGYLTIWPQGEPQPTVSTLNNPTATDVANTAIVPAGTDGGVAVFPSNDTDLILDINGYFAAAGTGGLSLYPTVPCRVLDTRGVGSGDPIVGKYTVNVAGSACASPTTAQAYVFNATVVPSGALGYLSLWPDGQGQPVVSTLNALDGAITSNMAIVPTVNGSIDSYASNLTQLVLDISSYFAP